MGAVPLLIAPFPPPAGLLRGPAYVGPERRNLASRERLVRCIRREFEELPGLQLTFAQAMLLFDLETGCCHRVLGGLVQSGFLMRGKGGQFMRRDLIV